MHEILNSFKQKNPSQNFKKNSSTLKNPKNFQKLQNLGFKTWNACKWEIQSLPSEEKLVKARRNLKEEVWSEWERFGRWKDKAIEREIERNENWIA